MAGNGIKKGKTLMNCGKKMAMLNIVFKNAGILSKVLRNQKNQEIAHG